MHLKTGQLALYGVMLGLTVLSIILGSIIESSTLFFLLLAAFLTGLIFREGKIASGWAYYIAAIFLSFILSPNKVYCVTYAVFALYFSIRETIQIILIRKKKYPGKEVLFLINLILFNLIYIPVVFFAPELLFKGDLSFTVRVFSLLLGQLVFLIVNYAYRYFADKYWSRLKNKLN